MSAEKLEEKKTDPKVRFAELRSDERKLVENIKDKEKEIKIILAQLQALRQLMAEVADEMEVEEYKKTIHEEKEERDRQIENLEEIVAEVKQEVEKKEGERTLYTGINAQQITLAANENTINRMYELAYKTGVWTDAESKEFFEIRDAVFQVRNYDLAKNLSQTVDNVYKALQVVTEQKSDQIKQNYKPQYASNITSIPLPPLNNQFNTTNITQNYKSNTNNQTLTEKIDKKKLDF